MQPAQVDPDLSVQQAGDTTVVRLLIADLSWPAAESIGNQLLALAREKWRRQLVIDMNRVRFLTAAALGMLVILAKELAASGGRLTLENVDRDAFEVFAVTNVTAILDVRAKGERPASWPGSPAANFGSSFCQSA